MGNTNGELTFERTIPAKPEDVYYAVSTAQGWRNWLVDAAYFRAQPGGSFHLSWDSGWYAAGTVEEMEKPSTVNLNWVGQDDPAATQVAIQLEPKGDATVVKLIHSGFGEGEAWEASREMSARGWETGLENLESIFDTGADLRFTRRPMLGVMGNDFNEEIAARIGVPVKEGFRLADVVEGMGAEKVGLQGDDVIVEMDDTLVRDGEDLAPILQRRQAGDVMEVTFYRGSEKKTAKMELSGRPLVDAPLDPAAFAQEYRQVAAEITKELREALEGATEEEADYTEADAWSVKENIAHLIAGEEWNLFYLTELIVDGVPQYSGIWENRREQLRAVVKVTPTLDQLVQRLETAYEQTCSLLEESAPVLRHRKGVMWNLGQWWLELPGTHEREHIEQIKKDLEKIRGMEAEPAVS